jgi:hypothetical protein
MQGTVDRRALFLQGFALSKRGNLWRRYEGRTLAVFMRSTGGFAYSVAGPDGPSFSRARYATEAEALDALWEHLQD